MASGQALVTAVAGSAATPRGYELPSSLDLEITSISVQWDGSGAAAAFKPCVALYDADGNLLSRTFPPDNFAVGDTGEVTYAPF